MASCRRTCSTLAKGTSAIGCTKWKSPFQVGRHGAPAEIAFRYLVFMQGSALQQQLHELAGMTLVCDCPRNQHCHADVLVGLCWELYCSDQPSTRKTGVPVRHVRMAALAAGVRSVSPAPAVFQQESVVAAVKNLFPAVSFRGVQFPTLVDVLNTETSLGFCVWAHGPGVLQILDMKPCRLVGLLPGSSPRIAAASDAAQDGPESGSGGFLISTPSLERVGAVVHIDLSVFALWRTATTKIAQLELLMVLQALLTFLDAFRGATGVFYVDNIAALMSLVRGRSDSHELDYLSRLIHTPPVST